MKRLSIIPVLVLMLMAACSSSKTDGTANSNTAPSREPQATAVIAPSPAPQPAAQPQDANIAQPNANSNAVDDAKAKRLAQSKEIAPPAAPITPDAPKLIVPVKKIDFGKQPQEKTLTRTFVVKNGGKSQLQIESVTPSWGCTAVDFPKVLPPGKAGTIKVNIDTGKSPGVHTKSVTIRSNDPAQPAVIVELVIDVKG